MCGLLDKVIEERNRLRLKYTELGEKYKKISWDVVKLTNDLAIRDKKLHKIQRWVQLHSQEMPDLKELQHILDD